MTAIAMAISGIVTGFVLEALIVLLALKPYDLSDSERASQGLDVSLPLSGRTIGSAPALLDAKSLPRTAAIAVMTAATFALVGLQYQGDKLHLAIVAAYVSVLIVCSATDMLSFRVPNVVTYPAIVGAFVVGMAMPGANSLDVIGGGLLFGGILFVVSILTSGSMGMGSVKLALFIGFALGLTLAVWSMLITLVVSGIIVTLLLATHIRGKGDSIPYAPFLGSGALLTMLIWGTAFRST